MNKNSKEYMFENIRVNEHIVYTDKPVGELKIINSPDNHLEDEKDLEYLKKQSKIFKEVIKPDAICFSGDFLDTIDAVNHNIRFMYSVLYELENMAKGTPVYYSMSNHDCTTIKNGKECNGNIELWVKMLQEIKNVHLFLPYEHKMYTLREGVNILGYSTDANRSNKGEGAQMTLKEISEYLKLMNLNEKHFNSLLCHIPEIVFNGKTLKTAEELEWYYINLIFAGHTHAGMLPKSLENAFGGCGFVMPLKDLGTPHYAGIHQNEDFAIDVSRGLKKVPGTAHEILHPFNHLYKKDVNLVRVIKK